MEIEFNKSLDLFEQNGISVFIEKYENGKITLVLSPSGIPQSKLKECAKSLKYIIE